MSITAMGAFEGSTFEELRWAYRQRWSRSDYACSDSAVASQASAMCLHAAVDRWAVTRAEAAAAAKPHGYCLETSFTSAQVRRGSDHFELAFASCVIILAVQPMHGWTVQHAIRELWQNLRDGAAAAFGPGVLATTFSADRCILARLLRDISVDFADKEGIDEGSDGEEEWDEEDECAEEEGDEEGGEEDKEAAAEASQSRPCNMTEGDSATREEGFVSAHDVDAEPLLGRVELSVNGVPVGSVDASAANVVVFTQRFTALQPRHLLLASSKGAHAAGAHGEGFKVAINLLLSRGFGVTYIMDGQRWRFIHEPRHSADVLTMVVQVRLGVWWSSSCAVSCAPQSIFSDDTHARRLY